MAKLIGPLLSIEARKSLAEVLSFAINTSKQYVKKFPTPSKTESFSQYINRYKYKNALATWDQLTPEQKEGWDSITSVPFPTNFNIYLSKFLIAIRDHKHTTKLYDNTPWHPHLETSSLQPPLLSNVSTTADDDYFYILSSYPAGSYYILKVLKYDTSVSTFHNLNLTNCDKIVICGNKIVISQSLNGGWIHIFDKNTFSHDSYQLFVNPPRYVKDMYVFESKVWAISSQIPSSVYRFSTDDLPGFEGWTLPFGTKPISLVLADSNYIFYPSWTESAILYAAPASDPANITSYTFTLWDHWYSSICDDELYIYIGNGGNMGQITKVLKSDPTQYIMYKPIDHDWSVHSVLIDDNYIYARSADGSNIITRALKSNLHFDSEISLGPFAGGSWDMCADGTFLFCTSMDPLNQLHKLYL